MEEINEVAEPNAASIDQRALQAVAVFTAGDPARPVLNQVAVYGPDLLAATDSYTLALVGQKGEKPVELVRRFYEADRPAVGGGKTITPRLLDVDDIARAVKLAAKPSSREATSWLVGESTVRLPDGSSIPAKAMDAQFPNLHALLSMETPLRVADLTLSTAKLAAFHKAAQLLYGATGVKRGDVLPPVTFHGGVDKLKPSYWSMAADAGTLVLLLMPVKSDRAWA